MLRLSLVCISLLEMIGNFPIVWWYDFILNIIWISVRCRLTSKKKEFVIWHILYGHLIIFQACPESVQKFKVQFKIKHFGSYHTLSKLASNIPVRKSDFCLPDISPRLVLYWCLSCQYAFLRLYFSFPVFQGKWSFWPYMVCSTFFIVPFFLARLSLLSCIFTCNPTFYYLKNWKLFFHSEFE